jgi:enoyl-CoA hydratase
MIDVSRRGGVAVLTIAHGKANALDVELCDALAKCLRDLRVGEARAVVITGTGRMFSAGVDLPRLLDGGATYVRRFLPALDRFYEAAFFFPKPLIAAVNGHAIAGGCVLACCADRRFMARQAGRIGVTEILVGVPFPAMAFEAMRFAMPPRYLSDTILTGATFDAEAAQARGLVDEVVEPDQLMDRAVAAAAAFGELPPTAFAMSKLQIRQPVADRLREHRADTDAAAEKVWASPATHAFIRDYVARTFKKA